MLYPTGFVRAINTLIFSLSLCFAFYERYKTVSPIADDVKITHRIEPHNEHYFRLLQTNHNIYSVGVSSQQPNRNKVIAVQGT